MKSDIIFATFAESEEQLSHAFVMSESIRAFTEKYKDSPIWIYVPESIPEIADEFGEKLALLDVEIKTCSSPQDALRFYYARKVFAAAKAESESEAKTNILVWMDDDTVFLKEPSDFMFKDGICFGYRPVMHKLIGSTYSEPPDEFWSQIYDDLGVPDSAFFPMLTHTDQETIRPYFNAGILVVRPERGILRKWAKSFPILYRDPALLKMCKEDEIKQIFLHQTALAGAVLLLVKHEEMIEFDEMVNYPMFFKAMFDSAKEYNCLDDVVTLRYDVYFRKPAPNWSDQLIGPEDKIDWLKARLGK
jgi:hypothetical protein